MESIILEQKQALASTGGDLAREREVQEQLVQQLEEERKTLQVIRDRLKEQDELLVKRLVCQLN
jgi:hypothetical protein